MANSSSTNPNLAPAHTLIARHPRTSMTHASLSSPTETHAAAAGVFPRPQHHGTTGSPNWGDDHNGAPGSFGGHNRNRSTSLSLSDLEETMEFAPGVVDGDSDEAGREPIEVDPTFRKDAEWPGTVKIVVEATTFWAHKEVLVFASPFFEAVLRGCWAESGRPASLSSVITISQPPVVPPGPQTPSTQPLSSSDIIQEESRPSTDSGHDSANSAPANCEDTSPEVDHGEALTCSTIDVSSEDALSRSSSPGPLASLTGKGKERALDASLSEGDEPSTARQAQFQESLSKLIGKTPASESQVQDSSALQLPGRSTMNQRRGRRKSRWPVATIHLKEEKAPIFHDFLKFVYPHLDCTITWNNVEGLMNISHKLVVPALQQKCSTFLLTHAAGKPIKAIRIAELFDEEELYREASRFVLDNPGGWSDWELGTLSHVTLWKLEKRRTWFLERVLKLGLVNIAKEYLCCATCPDPPACAKALEDKWRQNYTALFRFGPVQPSMCYRYLRSLEGVSPPLHLTQLSCQMFAKNWIASLFDRMFALGVHLTPLSGRGVVASPSGNGPRRHFLYCVLNEEQEKKKGISRANASNGNGAGRGNGLPTHRSGLSISRGNS